jgi:DNA-binding CsgD family transcriptional regulator
MRSNVALLQTAPAASDGADRDRRLTRRERESLSLVAQGKTDWEIANIFGIAETTARFHVDNARRKLDAVNRAHAVARFLAFYHPVVELAAPSRG